MAQNQYLQTRFEWLDRLAANSTVISALDLKNGTKDEFYRDPKTGKQINADAFSFSNCLLHTNAIKQTIDGLTYHGASAETLRKLLLDLTSRTTYGTMCELSAYSFLLKGGLAFDVQPHLTGAEILNPNGSDLDGVIRLPEEIYFDIKAFGFHIHLLERLKERLCSDFSSNHISIDRSWDVSITLLNELLGAQYSALKNELSTHGTAQREVMRFTLSAPSRFKVSTVTVNPEELACKNSGYAFNYAKQFVRTKPFFLIFVVHPWISGGTFHQNFGNYTDDFMNEFASKTFCKFKADQRQVFGISMGDASALLSGLIFINAWEGNPPTQPPRYRCYLNPNAKNKISESSIQTLRSAYGTEIKISKIDCPGS